MIESYVARSDGVAVERQRWPRGGLDSTPFRQSRLRAVALVAPAAVAASAGTASASVPRVAVQP